MKQPEGSQETRTISEDYFSEFTIRDLEELARCVELERNRRFHQQIFGESPNANVGLASAWLEAQKTKTLDDTDKIIVSHSLQWLRRKHHFKLILTKDGRQQECALTTAHDRARNRTRFSLRTPDGDQKRLMSPLQLPEGLSLTQ